MIPAVASRLLLGQAQILSAIVFLNRNMTTMSNTLSADVAALTQAVADQATAIAAEAATTAAAVAEINKLIAAGPGSVDQATLDAITAATTAIQTATGNITTASNSLAAAVPPAAP